MDDNADESQGESPASVFISFSSLDRPIAQRVCEFLGRAGIRPWISDRDIAGGTRWSTEIVDGLHRSDACIVILSRNSNTSRHVAREISLATSRNLPIIPFRIEPLTLSDDLKYELGDLELVDSFNGPFDAALPRLLTAIRRHVNDKPTVGAARRKRALASSARGILWSAAVIGAIGFAILRANLLGGSKALEHFSQDLLNVVLAPLYPATAQKQITAILIDDDSLRHLGENWPPAYAFHAQVLDAVLASKPRGVMIDLIFQDRREEFTLPQLKTTLRKYAEAKIPVYTATTSLSGDGIRPELEGQVTLVPVLQETDHHDHASRTYPLLLPHYNEHVQTAALRMYTDLAVSEHLTQVDLERRFGYSMHIIWGTLPPSSNLEWIACEPPATTVAAALSRRLFADDTGGKTDCYYTQTLWVEHLMSDFDSPEVRDLLADRFVFYGQSLVGLGDLIYPPTHTRLPGVFLHAMALDNLLTLGDDFIRRPRPGTALDRWTWLLELLILFAYGAFIGLRDNVREQALHGGWTRFGLMALLTLGALVAGLLFSFVVTFWAFQALRLATVNWVGCLLIALFMMFMKDWIARWELG